MEFRYQEITNSGEGIMEFQQLFTYQLLYFLDVNGSNPQKNIIFVI